MEDNRAYVKIMNFTRGSSLVILFFNFYIFCYGFFEQFNLTSPFAAKFILSFGFIEIYQISYLSKGVAFILLLISCLGVTTSQTEEITWRVTLPYIFFGPIIYFGADLLLNQPLVIYLKASMYMFFSILGFLLILQGGNYLSRILKINLLNDIFNEENQSFPQEERLMQNHYSVNIPTLYTFRKKVCKGWINVVNPFRGGMVLGTPGSGKSFVFINAYIKQLIAKGFSMYIYDYKFDDLSKIAYNALINNYAKYPIKPQFYIINFDNPQKSHRCNPLLPSMMSDISDAYESASTIMLNLNRSWIQKQGDFFIESPINFVTSIIWFLKLYENGKYCTFPHVIEFLSAKYEEIFPILGAYPEIEVYVKPFVSAFESGASEQLEGQIASARIGLARLASPQLYWVMSGNDFTLDINNPDEPKIVCVGNNPLRQSIYGAALGLYNARLVKLINRKGKLPSAMIIDELATIFFKGLDQLIATARSNKVATLLGFQDFSQIERDYGKGEATVIENIIGNVFVGQVVGDTAKKLSERFGKINQKKQSISTSNRSGTSVSISTGLDYRIPPSVMAELSQGTFVGAVADDRDQKIKLKVFHADIIIDEKQTSAETATYLDIPDFNKTTFVDSITKEDKTDEVIQRNYYQVKEDIKYIIMEEHKRILEDDKLRHLIKCKQSV
ncbi:conjugal transfer protein MobC [Rhodocytophaga aerolata]